MNFYYGDVLKTFNDKCGSCTNQNPRGRPGGSTQEVKCSVYLLTYNTHFNIMTIKINISIMYWVNIRTSSKFEKLSETRMFKSQQFHIIEVKS